MNVFVQSFIDPEEWDAAKWSATAFFHDPSGVRLPCLGIMFENIEAGKRIFASWRERLGNVDQYDELRISIVEGDILGKKSGYSVHVSSDPDHTAMRAKAEGKELDVETALVMGRVHRMTPEPGSPHLRRFKQEFAKHNRYFLIPVSSAAKPEMDFAIGKAEVHFRQASQITKEDVDAVVFPSGYFDGTIQ